MWGCYIKHRSALCNLIFSTELEMKRAQKLAVIRAAAKLPCALLLPGWEPQYDFIAINHSERLIRNNQIICQKAFQRVRENLAACSWISLIISLNFPGTSCNISSRFPVWQSRASAAFLHFSSWNELQFQIFRDIIKKAVIPPKRIQSLLGDSFPTFGGRGQGNREGKSWFSCISGDLTQGCPTERARERKLAFFAKKKKSFFL